MEDSDLDVEMIDAPPLAVTEPSARFEDLPVELHEMILEIIMDSFMTAIKTKEGGKNARESWALARRYIGSTYFSNLALISRLWRHLVQSRLYRHEPLWFVNHRHLAMHVRHIEFFVPPINTNVGYGYTTPNTTYIPKITFIERMRMSRFSRRFVMQGFPVGTGLLRISPVAFNKYYVTPLSIIFRLIQICFPVASILTLSRDITYNTGMMNYFPILPPNMFGYLRLPSLGRIQVLILDTPWNVMRASAEWVKISAALPSLKECQCVYIQPQDPMYISMYFVIGIIHPTLCHLNINMAPYHPAVPAPSPTIHICDFINVRAPYLQSITLTGCFCDSLFRLQNSNIIPLESTTITSVELYLVAICEGYGNFENTPQIIRPTFWNWQYFVAFERVVLGALGWLQRHRTLQTI
ncbi:hypothetical protein PHISCL_03891 [Aspergillus sclerotialis]|uniref:Uncharacterized protein n=1 Tax=Aspergillus sclerotialis TaxID=2070753 RepID=A0A3A3A323_9EURO|nr:hypothetical protein PHISCL_03891 [Aspergillus sclerotialis]